VLTRFTRSWLLALGTAAAAALLEASWAYAVTTQPLNGVRTWLTAFGALVPVALVVALILSAVSPVLFGSAEAGGARSPEGVGAGQRSHAVNGMPVLGFAAALLLALLGHLALSLLALGLEPLVFLASLALGTGLLARLVLGASLALNERLDSGGAGSRLPAPLAFGLGGLLFAGPIVWGIARGTTNGEGGFWNVFGVLRRQELDLRAALLLAALAVAAYVGARRRGQRDTSAILLCASSVALLAFSATALRLLDDAPLSLALERGGALSRASLRVLRAATDGDQDGVSAYFGAHDCDDTRDDIYPGAPDSPGNGLDEDCSGRDSQLVTVAARLRPSPAPAASVPTIQTRLPPDLNVILISVDTLRHDLGYMGYGRPISRNLDQLAAKSTVFERAYSLASYTGKSIGPLLIGKYPSETRRGWLHFNRFGTDETFVQERLQAAGIRTIGVQGHWYFTPEYGVGRGFDVLDLSATPTERQLDGDTTVNSHKLSDAAIRQLSKPENAQSRFFMWVHYLDPHAEYQRHPGFDFGSRGRDLYDSEVAFTDQQIGRLLDFVAASELGARTAIVVTSDHGEAFGEHGMYRHGNEVWEALVRVPLIVYVPGVAPGRQTIRRSAVDLAPTLLDLLSVPAPIGEQHLSGQSLLADVLMPSGYAPTPRPVFIDMSAGPYNEERQALIQDDIKLISSAGRTLGLYDLARDPGEEIDRAADAELLALARERFSTFRSELRLVPVKPH
jgi:choline-sulfatase